MRGGGIYGGIQRKGAKQERGREQRKKREWFREYWWRTMAIKRTYSYPIPLYINIKSEKFL